MRWFISSNLWIIAALPFAAGAALSLTRQRHRRLATVLAVGAMGLSFLLAVMAFGETLTFRANGTAHRVVNLHWFQFGNEWIKIGWLLDPLTATMLLMVTFVGLLIFIYSTGYMSEDENYTRFFCFLSLFAGAMLGVVLSNSLLLLFMCWEIVGLTSYLLIGFWFTNPNAAAAAKKAFIVTRIGDLGFFLGMLWIYWQSGTLLFYDNGAGCLEHSALTSFSTHTTILGLSVSSAIGILIFCGAAGKSGQVPLHVWLPDAMEGPTPVSALIHAATMVAAGVFLIARIYPLMSAQGTASIPLSSTVALQVVTWVGAITALFGAVVAVAQWDIKRILAYSTISQLGYMMIGLGIGGVAVGMFHLITHAFFKALLFLGAGSVIHGCGGEQDIRNMGGLRKTMPITFAAYTCGMLALCGFPMFAGFWSKDEILHTAFVWSLSRIPFYMGMIGAFLTAFYMTRQMCYVFAGSSRQQTDNGDAHGTEEDLHVHTPHESPTIMTAPLAILSFFAVFLGLIGTPSWPIFQSFLNGESFSVQHGIFLRDLPLMVLSSVIVVSGLVIGWLLYRNIKGNGQDLIDSLQRKRPRIFDIVSRAFLVNELYHATVIRLTSVMTAISAWLDQYLWGGIIQTVSSLTIVLAKADSYTESHFINRGFDQGCNGVRLGSTRLSQFQSGQTQRYLRTLAAVLALGTILLICGAQS